MKFWIFDYLLFLINPVGIRATLIAMGLAFIIFRILDITKIGPIYKSQNFGNGVGVVLDDFHWNYRETHFSIYSDKILH